MNLNDEFIYDKTLLSQFCFLFFSAVISALKNLQEKVRKLELERGAAENNLKSLAAETIRYKDILQKEHENEQPIQSTMSKHTQGT